MSAIELQLNPLVAGDAVKIAQPVTEEQETLIKHCVKYKEVLWFLRITANYWPHSTPLLSVDKIWYVLARAILALSCVLYFLVFLDMLSMSKYISAFIFMTLIIRVVSLLPAQHHNQCRLHMTATADDALSLAESVSAAVVFGIVGTCANFLGQILYAADGLYIEAAVFLTEHVATAYLAFNMFLLLLDLNVCTKLLEKLHLIAANKTLSMKNFTEVRSEIHSRVRRSRWITDIIIVPCAVCASAIALTVWTLAHPHRRTSSFTGFIMLMVKELMFLFTAFWYVAKLNGKADELTAMLAESEWGVYDDAARVAQSDVETPLILEAAQVPDIHRLSIYASSLSKPISYTLVFKRVTWWNVAVSAGGFVLAIVIGIIRSLILADV